MEQSLVLAALCYYLASGYCGFSDLERSVEEMKTGAGLNHHLVTEQEVEQKSQELRRLGETLTKLKSKSRN